MFFIINLVKLSLHLFSTLVEFSYSYFLSGSRVTGDVASRAMLIRTKVMPGCERLGEFFSDPCFLSMRFFNELENIRFGNQSIKDSLADCCSKS